MEYMCYTLNHILLIGVVAPNYALVMEYMQCSLYEALHIEDDYHITPSDRRSLIYQIIQGLMYLHSEKIAHCDFKSSNILLQESYTSPPGTNIQYNIFSRKSCFIQ